MNIVLLLLALALPGISSAYEKADYAIPGFGVDVHEFISDMMSNFDSASVTTGGIHISTSSVSSGSSSASVSIVNVINAKGASGTVDAQIRTEQDGVVQTQVVHEAIELGRSVDIHIATTPGDRSGAVRAVVVASSSASSTIGAHTSALSFLFGRGGLFSVLFAHPFSFFGF